MVPFLDIGLVLLGLLLIMKSSALAVNSLVRLSADFGLTEFTTSFLVIGLASVLPELFLALAAALGGAPVLGLGVVFGSNIVDLTLVLGIVAVYGGGIKIESKTVQSNLLFLLLAVLPVLLVLDGELGRVDGVILILAFVFYVARLSQERKSFSKTLEGIRKRKSDFFDDLVIAAFAIGVLMVAAYLVSNAALNISSVLALPLVVIGVAMAFGTCLPELSFSLQALRERHPELSLGDIVGNVITDCTFTLGVLAIVSPIRIPDAAVLPVGLVMVAASLLAVWFMRSGSFLSKREGVALVIVYCAFLLAQAWFAVA